MTECERIVQQGILPESFFEPETICDFYVDKDRKKVWAIELDLIYEFDKVCRKHGLQYFLMFGSLLGAIRHKGFVPWDDDVDVVMPREDYDKLFRLSEEFTYPYFLQTPYTDNDYWYSYAKIRNSNTTGISKKFSYNKYNHGMFLDVFPLDYVNENYTIEYYEQIKSLILENSTYMKKSNKSLSEVDSIRVKNHKGLDPLSVYEKINEMATAFSRDSDCKSISTVLLPLYPYKSSIFDAEDFESAIYCNIYGMKIPVPIGYDNILKILYGNYLEFPPIEKRGQWHDDLYFDPDVNYKESLKKLHEGQI